MSKAIIFQLGLLSCLLLSNEQLFAQQAGKQVPIKVPVTVSAANSLLYLPDDYDKSGKTYPILLFFHGSGEAGANLDLLRSQGLPKAIDDGNVPFSVKAGTKDTTKFIVLSIQSPSSNPYKSPDGKTMLAGVETLVNDYHIRIDKNRMYPTGLSAGGRESLWAVRDFPDKFPAAVPMSIADGITASQVSSFKNAYIWFFIGTLDIDRRKDATTNSNQLINQAYPGHSRITEYNNGHCCWPTYYNPNWRDPNGLNIYDFLLKYSLNGSSQPVVVPPVSPSSTDSSTASKGTNPNVTIKADAGVDRTVTLPKDTLILNGSNSTGTITNWTWAKRSGPDGASILSNGSTATITGLKQGVYEFTLTVSGDSGYPSSAKVTITVQSQVSAPPAVPVVANAGSDRTITLPQDSVWLSGTASKGSITSWTWTQGSSNPKANLSPKDSMAVVTNLQEGVYDFYLTVSGPGSPNPSSAKVTITVKAALKSTSTETVAANAGIDRTITLPQDSVWLDGTASTGTITSWTWSQATTNPKSSLLTKGSSAVVSNLQEGVYVFYLTVSGPNSQWPSSAKVTITVKPEVNTQPVLANAGQDRAITLPQDSVWLDGTASTGNITSWTWSQANTNPKSTLSYNGSRAVVTNLQQGVYEFYLTVSGPNSPWPSSSKVTITVNSTANAGGRAFADAGPDRTVTLPKDSIILNGKGSTGAITSWTWSQGSSNPKSTINSMGSTAVVTNLQPGVYEFFLTVNGPDSPWPSSAKVTITVKSNNQRSAVASVATAGVQTDVEQQPTTQSFAINPEDAPTSADREISLTAYPNPVHNQLYVELNNLKNDKVTMRLIDMNGAVLKTYDFGVQSYSFKQAIDVNSLKNGMYFIQLINDNNITKTQKFIKF